MKRFIGHLTVALNTFLFGIMAAQLSGYILLPGSKTDMIAVAAPSEPPELRSVEAEPLNLSSKESEVVAEAEYFVCWNGYTHQGCGGVGHVY